MNNRCDACGMKGPTVKTGVPLAGEIIGYLWLCHPSCGIQGITYFKERLKNHPLFGRKTEKDPT